MTLDDIYKDARFELYFKLLTEWNQKFNLTSVTDRENVYLKHFYDSVLPLSEDISPPVFKQNAQVLDVGSGAGFPGVCLKLARPDLDITMIETVGKKVLFLTHLLTELGLDGIRAVKTRIEDFKQKDFDHVVARAVAPLSTLSEYCLPFLKKGGSACFYKSASATEEIEAAGRAISFLGGKVSSVVTLPLDSETLRNFIIITKTKDTPSGYPRGGNKPRLLPLS